MNSLGSRITGTVILGVSWFVLIVLYLAFFADNMDFWQKLAIFIASGAIVCGIAGIMWIRWAFRE